MYEISKMFIFDIDYTFFLFKFTWTLSIFIIWFIFFFFFFVDNWNFLLITFCINEVLINIIFKFKFLLLLSFFSSGHQNIHEECFKL